MSFKCGCCGKQVFAKPIKKVAETRPQTYVNEVNGKEKISHGHEIVKELDLCSKCIQKIQK